MSRTDFQSDWTPFRDAILTRFPGLSETDLSDADGSIAALSQRLARVEDVSPSEAEQSINEFLGGPMPADAHAAPQHDNAAMQEAKDYIPEGEDPLADDRRFGDDHIADRPMGRTRS
ncbi:hypothetical protein [Jannaschia formosa]|uniref:hypothetical protein n=1 Tax=Jannaschia formosa TaxID=2259592 RepID=UPI000E1B94B8|nr:hypothetical protein [Jannaschia formosa]TFL16905.1 hypothetical protein DR046_17385 [Jannaschia formosa]